MSVTRCVGSFSKRLEKLPMDGVRWKAEIMAIPESCEFDDCSPGGCRRHCDAYARGAWVRMKAQTKRARK